MIVERGGPWLKVQRFRRAVDFLREALPGFAVPLVFSNGDYNPLNVLHDGGRVTGWVDFEGACFEDPLVRLPIYPVRVRDGRVAIGIAP